MHCHIIELGINDVIVVQSSCSVTLWLLGINAFGERVRCNL